MQEPWRRENRKTELGDVGQGETRRGNPLGNYCFEESGRRDLNPAPSGPKACRASPLSLIPHARRSKEAQDARRIVSPRAGCAGKQADNQADSFHRFL